MPARQRHRGLVPLLLAATWAGPGGCFNDYDKFDLTGAGPSAAAMGGADDAPSGGSGNPADEGGTSAEGGTAAGGAPAPGGTFALGGAAQGGSTEQPTGGTGLAEGGTSGGNFEVGGVAATAGGSGNVSGLGGTGDVSGLGGTSAGAGGKGDAGASGGSPCGADQKMCGTTCVRSDDPQNGCAESSCNACVVPNGSAACRSGLCGVGQCSSGYFDCNGQAADGCEHSLATFGRDHCGGCGNNCALQGLSGGLSCLNGLCGCTSAAQCSDRGDILCDGQRTCVCTGTVCQPGETCKRSANIYVCGCNGGATCATGTVCCFSPSGCFDLQRDNNNCGACGWVCATGTSCVAGKCQ